MKKYLIILSGLLLIVFFHSSNTLSQQQSAVKEHKSFIWEVKSDKSTVYILGSIHVAKPDLYPLDDKIEKAFNESSKLVLEINPLTIDNAEVQKIVLKDGLYPEDDTIKNHIKPDVLEMLDKYLKKENMTTEMIQNMKPGLLAMTLSMYQLTRLGYSSEYGIDNYFAKKSSGKKDILELETIESQVSMLLNIPDGNLLLRYTLEEMENLDKFLDQISEAWKEGDSNGVYELVIKPYESDPLLKTIMDKLFFDRNVKMASKIEDYLKSGGKYFVVVGAGHLVGDKGIISLLRRDNHKVEQL